MLENIFPVTVFETDRHVTPGSFNIEVKDGKAYVPEELRPCLSNYNFNLGVVYEVLKNNPSCAPQVFGWSPEHATSSIAELKILVEPFAAPGYFEQDNSLKKELSETYPGAVYRDEDVSWT